MSTFREFAKEQAQRLSGTVGFPAGQDGLVALREVVDALEKTSKGQRSFIAKVIDRCLETSKFCPTVADIHTVAGTLRDDGIARELGYEDYAKAWERSVGR